LVEKLNHAETVIHDLTGDKELLKSELERSRDMANYSHGQLYSMNEYCIKEGFEFIQNNPAFTMIHEMGKLRSERDALAAQVEHIRAVFKQELFNAKGLAALEKAIDSTPEQCLAEIRAEAVDGLNSNEQFEAFLKTRVGSANSYEIGNWLDQYAEQIRQGGVK